MSISSKGFEEAEERLEELYTKCDCLMADNAESSLIKATISLMNNVFAEMERLVIRESSEDSKQLLQTRLKKHYEFRCKFDERIAICFQGNYALQQAAKDNDLLFPQDVIATVLENFYMDDCLKSVNSAEEAINCLNC